MRVGVANDNQNPLGARAPLEVPPHQPEHHLVGLWLVASARRLHVVDETDQLGKVVGEVDVLGDVNAGVAVVAVSDDGGGDGGDVGLQSLQHVGQTTSDLAQGAAHGTGGVEGEDHFQRTVRGHGGHL